MAPASVLDQRANSATVACPSSWMRIKGTHWALVRSREARRRSAWYTSESIDRFIR